MTGHDRPPQTDAGCHRPAQAKVFAVVVRAISKANSLFLVFITVVRFVSAH